MVALYGRPGWANCLLCGRLFVVTVYDPGVVCRGATSVPNRCPWCGGPPRLLSVENENEDRSHAEKS